MNLELFPEAHATALDEVLDAAHDELDALFLDEVEGVLRQIRAEKDVKPDVAVA